MVWAEVCHLPGRGGVRSDAGQTYANPILIEQSPSVECNFVLGPR